MTNRATSNREVDPRVPDFVVLDCIETGMRIAFGPFRGYDAAREWASGATPDSDIVPVVRPKMTDA